ncbi:MAG: class I SAM-dependent methyltransferase [Synechococcaceae cyanobacterium RL_1_2]|nr:class I SAM-dependent methyltransferase [Synechococcaceae cyanobacterium RL_1_2]
MEEARTQGGTSYDWFEPLYRQAGRNITEIPWAKLHPHPALVSWFQNHTVPVVGRTGLVVGCGLGDDAEFIQKLGYLTTAFDVAPGAIEWCQSRFPRSPVSYEVGDLFTWSDGADLVIEHRTVQALPLELRTQAINQVCALVNPSGLLIVITNTRPTETPPEGPPWPLSPQEIGQFHQGSLSLMETIAIEENHGMLVFKNQV